MGAPGNRGLLALSGILLIAGFVNDPPWRGFDRERQVQFVSEPVRIAGNLVARGEFANPFGSRPTGLTAHSAPGFPFIVSILLRLFGGGAGGWLALRCLATLALSLQFALLPWCARWLGYSAWTGLLAAVFGLASKPGKEELWETHVAGLLVLLLTACAYLWSRTPGARRGLVVGIVAALTLHVQPVAVAPYLVWIALTGWRFGLTSRSVLPLWLAPLLLCAPWTVRNQVRLGGLTWMRDDLGVELNVSFNGCAPYGFEQSLARFCIQGIHPNTSLREADAVARLGEYRYNRERLHRALAWIRGHGRRAARLSLERAWFFWFPSGGGWRGYLKQEKRTLLWHALTLLSFAGVCLSWKRYVPSISLLMIWLLAYPLVYYLIQFAPRYRFPILWITWIQAAYFCGFAARWIAGKMRTSFQRSSLSGMQNGRPIHAGPGTKQVAGNRF
jgi:hypothetical protein